MSDVSMEKLTARDGKSAEDGESERDGESFALNSGDGSVDTVTAARTKVRVLKKNTPAGYKGPEKVPVKRVAAYCRVSTDREEQKISLKTQIESFRQLISSRPGWELAEIYTDEGISGTQALHRDSFNRMIQDCKDGKIDRIITKSISRFARNTVECLSFVRELKSCGVYVYFEKEKMDTEQEASEMALSILAAVAQEESRNLSENMKWGVRKRFAEGKVKWSPTYGFKKIDGEEFIADPETAPVVKRIFDEYLHGRSLTQILKGLEEDHIPSAWGRCWYPKRIEEILMNEKYVGDAHCQKTCTIDHITHRKVPNDQTVVPAYYIKDHHEPIVERKVFEQVQQIRSMKDRHKGPIQYPYRGRITCPICGEKLERAVLPRSNAPAVWHCRPDRGNTACAGYYIEEKYIDDVIRKTYRDLDMEELRKQAEKKDPAIAKAAEAAIRMKNEMPELESVEYYFLDTMVGEIRIGKWDTAAVIWKCGLKSTAEIAYENEYAVPFSKRQKATKPVREWMKIAEEAAAEMKTEKSDIPAELLDGREGSE